MEKQRKKTEKNSNKNKKRKQKKHKTNAYMSLAVPRFDCQSRFVEAEAEDRVFKRKKRR